MSHSLDLLQVRSWPSAYPSLKSSTASESDSPVVHSGWYTSTKRCFNFPSENLLTLLRIKRSGAKLSWNRQLSSLETKLQRNVCLGNANCIWKVLRKPSNIIAIGSLQHFFQAPIHLRACILQLLFVAAGSLKVQHLHTALLLPGHTRESPQKLSQHICWL